MKFLFYIRHLQFVVYDSIYLSDACEMYLAS